MIDLPPLAALTAREMVAGYAARSFTPDDTLDACLARIDACQAAINAFIHVDVDGARAAARASTLRWSRGEPLGAIDGVPVSLKDNLDAAGMPTTWGSRLLSGYGPLEDELPVMRLRAAGAVLVGKTNLPEFAVQGYTDNLVFGPTRNPWNLDLTPGGSSGGAAASVAARCTPLALTTDGGGSTRRPASHCGLVGFKPSANRVERAAGLPEIFLDFEVIGAIARSVEDVELLIAAAGGMHEPATGTAGAWEAARVAGTASAARAARTEAAAAMANMNAARILYVPQFGDNPVDPRIASHCLDVVEDFRKLGHSVVAFDEACGFRLADDINAMWSRLSASGLARLFDDGPGWERTFGAGRSPDPSQCTRATQSLIANGRALSAPSLFELLANVKVLEYRIATGIFAPGHYDFLLTPCTAALPWPVGDTHPSTIAGVQVGPRGHAVFTALANAAGLPALALPTGTIDGLPTGVQLIGPRGCDAKVLAAGSAYHAAYPFDDTPRI
jgi:aspartyl-tRNA(Asn)/glutamyl-tRNA(Gln) amidotransferase subunit A